MNPQKALALDPGRTTGIAIATWDDAECKITYGQEILGHFDFYDFLHKQQADFIICESFRFRQGKTGVDLYPCELIGIVNLFCEVSKTKLYVQEPWVQSGKKIYFSDAKLKERNLYLKGLEHGRSAVKHLLYWLAFGAGSNFNVTQLPTYLV